MGTDADDDDLAEFEDDDLEDFGGPDLPPPPPPPPPPNRAQPPRPEYVELAARIKASTDPLERGAFAYDAIMVAIAEVMSSDMDPAERRRELRTLSAAAAKVFPAKRWHEAEAKVDAYLAQVDARKRAKVGADLVRRRETPHRGKVIPIRGSAVPGGSEP